MSSGMTVQRCQAASAAQAKSRASALGLPALPAGPAARARVSVARLPLGGAKEAASGKVPRMTAAAAKTTRSGSPTPSPSGWVPQGNSGENPKKYADNPLDESRPYRRTVFTLEDWKRHRTSDRYGRHIGSIFRSGIVRALLPASLWYAFDGAFFALWGTLQTEEMLPEWVPVLPDVGLAPFSLTAFALSLLLVFRTNSSYGRWDEARKMWGSQVNRSRDFTRQALTFMGDKAIAKDLGRWTKAFVKSFMCHMRDDKDVKEELLRVGMTPHEVAVITSMTHRPNFCLQVMSTLIRADKTLTPQMAQNLDSNLTTMEDALGGCERILRTPVPLFYTHHIARFMTIWLALLPLGLWHSLGWDVVPAMAVIAFLLLGIDEIGLQIEEPFGILPLEAITDTIAKNIDELCAQIDKAEGMIFEEGGVAAGMGAATMGAAAGAAAAAASSSNGPSIEAMQAAAANMGPPRPSSPSKYSKATNTVFGV